MHFVADAPHAGGTRQEDESHFLRRTGGRTGGIQEAGNKNIGLASVPVRAMVCVMNTCSCIESAKTLLTTGKWDGGGCECCKKVSPIALVIIAGVIGLLLSGLLGTFIVRRRKD